MKRVRVYGRPASLPLSSTPLACPAPALTNGTAALKATPLPISAGVPRVPALPLTPDAFSAYGSVIQSYPDQRSARKDVVIKAVNFGTAFKFNHLSDIAYTHPSVAAKINFCVFRCDAQDGEQDIKRKMSWNVDVLERHEFSTQAFVPMGGGGGRYLIVVALPGPGKYSLTLTCGIL
jgi:allantoicase